VLHPEGRLDGASSAVLETEAFGIIDAGALRLLIDLQNMDYVSSAGLRAFLAIAKRIIAAGGRLAVCSLKPNVAELFDVSGIDGVIDIHGSAASATWQLLAD
jgi:anti-anti-sigma factor